MSAIRLIMESDVDDPEATDIWVDCYVADELVRFRLDTGAATCRVPTSEATRLMPTTGMNDGVGACGTGLDETEIEIPRLRIGNVEVVNVAATRSSAELDGFALLGMSALGQFRCHFQFSTGHMELSKDGPSTTDDWFELSHLAGGQPTVSVCIDDVEVEACWDTGAGLTAVDTGFARTHSHLFEPIRQAIAVDASGVHMSANIAQMTACQIGGVEFGNSACALVDLGPLNAMLQLRAAQEQRFIPPVSFVLGTPVIIQADWVFDFPAARWTVCRFPDDS